ncbi:hypothetical protein [Clostridium fessum]|uniref:hypothetical protein n=1 Tax=Clostridium fessum TaxID=2126740 RepID=UPI0039A1F697
MEQQNITAVKGIGEKTAKLFQKIGVETVEELLHYYPRAYDEFKEPQPIAELKEDTIAAVGGILAKTADVVRYGARLQVTTAGLRDSGGTLALAWYNMPYLRGTLKAGERFIFRGRVVKKRGRLTMEQPEIYRPEQYAKVVSSMQPVYGQTKGLAIRRSQGSHGSLTMRRWNGNTAGWSAGKVRIGGNQLCAGAHPFSGKPGRTDVFPETSCV